MSGAKASENLDVTVKRVELFNSPATLKSTIKVGRELCFESTIQYNSIPAWGDIWEKFPDKRLPSRLIAAIVAWDCMRFLALGGTRLTLPGGLSCSKATQRIWRECFLKQFGEWRFRNHLYYSAPDLPRLECTESDRPESDDLFRSRMERASPQGRWLLANGGGKDTLASLLLLRDCKIPFDVYEGYLPIGGSIDRQTELLASLRSLFVERGSAVISVTIRDDFYGRPIQEFRDSGVEIDFFKTDFAVGHTANYVGYFPIVLYHGYTQMFFNIERSSDDAMATWDGEKINHQWCKSREYQSLSLEVFSECVNAPWFQGFSSTLRGLYDVGIYNLIARDKDLLKKTHSCNYGKPWCNRCPKCCFCYLMMSAYFGEEFAREVVGAEQSLFQMKENEPHWRDLFEPTRVAWECVPSHEECCLAASICLARGIQPPMLKAYGQNKDAISAATKTFSRVYWEDIPKELWQSVSQRLRTETHEPSA